MEDQTARLNLMTGKVRRLRHTQGALLDKIDSLEVQLEYQTDSAEFGRMMAQRHCDLLIEERDDHDETKMGLRISHLRQLEHDLRQVKHERDDYEATIDAQRKVIETLELDNQRIVIERNDIRLEGNVRSERYEELLCKYNELEECREDLQEKYEGKCEDFDTVMDRLKDIDAIIQEEI